jgi:hypothetical protein
VPITISDIFTAFRDYEQNTFVESLLQNTDHRIVGGTQGAKRAVPITISDIFTAFRDYEQILIKREILQIAYYYAYYYGQSS